MSALFVCQARWKILAWPRQATGAASLHRERSAPHQRSCWWKIDLTSCTCSRKGSPPAPYRRSLKKSCGRLPMISGGDVQRRIRALGTTNGEQTESGENQGVYMLPASLSVCISNTQSKL